MVKVPEKITKRVTSFHVGSSSLDILGASAPPAMQENANQLPNQNKSPSTKETRSNQTSKIFDDASITAGYESVPLIEIDILPRGGISFETKAVGRVQFGIPPETIKDSMILGMEVPTVYIVPVERFCRELGPALGLNLAEFEFPAYFNYFVRGKRVQLVVDSPDAEKDIRSVFGETLLGPENFRNREYPCACSDEDFDPNFPHEARPNFYKEFYNFRTAESTDNSSELSIDTLLEFIHFRHDRHSSTGNDRHRLLGVPPPPPPPSTHIDPGVDRSSISITAGNENDDVPIPPMTDLRRNSTSAGQKLRALGTTGATDDSALPTKSERNSKPEVLKRIQSESSFSSDRSQSSLTHRRGSGSSEMVQLPSPRPTGRRTSLPVGDLSEVSGNASFSLLDENVILSNGRRGSAVSFSSEISIDGVATVRPRFSRISRLSTTSSVMACAYDFLDDGNDLQDSKWMYSQAKWLGEVATVYPPNTTKEQKQSNGTPRVEIFKMAGGTEYIVHDVDENNIIVGKARFSGTVRAPDELDLKGFISSNDPLEQDRETDLNAENTTKVGTLGAARTFHPPSFGVTVLGNSHGFDRNGSTSGYVLWVNGRGIMIDPPPYSSAALEREGIRPQTIVAIIITHCHADHDAGAFQKIMTGARVAIITTPTIYKSFIRKYSALSGLKPTLLRHSHRYRAAIIGQPFRFQGATFHFTYTLHTIPCISFKVEWRGKSIVFTGDHMNIPEKIDMLEENGTLSKGRADDLRRLPIQDCDVLLHEAGAPPIHTPLHVLQALPERVRDRLFVVHTAAIPPDSGLRVAPTGTAGTIRLDKPQSISNSKNETTSNMEPDETKGQQNLIPFTPESLQDGSNKNLTVQGQFDSSSIKELARKDFEKTGDAKIPPLVFSRPTDVSDAWFILNLLSAVPFLTNLSYAHTMEVLEIANVEVFCSGEVVIEGPRRPDFLCVFWEGACKERIDDQRIYDKAESEASTYPPCVWHAGDWTGPVSLQPDIVRSAMIVPGEETSRDIIALSKEGVKVIVLSMKDLNRILKAGSKLFRKYLSIEQHQKRSDDDSSLIRNTLDHSHDSIIDVMSCNSVLGSLYPLQKRILESLAEEPRFFPYQTLMWKVGDPVDYAFLVVAGSATLGRKVGRAKSTRTNRRGSTGAITTSLRRIDEQGGDRQQLFSPMSHVEADKLLQNVQPNSEYARLETVLQIRMEEVEDNYLVTRNSSMTAATSSYRDRFANKVLARLYSRRAYTENLIFSRGNFLSDTSRMVSGDLANLHTTSIGSVRTSIGTSTSDHHFHTSNLIAGPEGCVVFIFPRTSLVPFLDSNPGVLLSLLGTQAVI